MRYVGVLDPEICRLLQVWPGHVSHKQEHGELQARPGGCANLRGEEELLVLNSQSSLWALSPNISR